MVSRVENPSVTPAVELEDEHSLDATSTQDYRSKIQAGRDAADKIREKARKDAQQKAIEERQIENALNRAQKKALLDDWEKGVKNGGVRTDEKGQRHTLNDEFVEQIRIVLRPDQRAYDDWRAAMMSLLSLFSAFVNDFEQSIKGQLAGAFAFFLDKARKGGYAFYDHFFCSFDEKDIPALFGNLKFDEENNLVIGNLDNASEVEFECLLAMWLQEQGYSYEDNAYRRDGEALTKDAFHEMVKENDFSQFLEKTIGISVDLSVELPHPLEKEPEDEPPSAPSMGA